MNDGCLYPWEYLISVITVIKKPISDEDQKCLFQINVPKGECVIISKDSDSNLYQWCQTMCEIESYILSRWFYDTLSCYHPVNYERTNRSTKEWVE